ncbi:MAG: thiamine diphosphokinase [Candidatus Eremiobacteraeota bacterium]|nr:thiamine diphosphokinase [Candidatus Eremiobacteraeota bacterium]
MQTRFRVAILAGGQPPDPDYCRQQVARADRLICANGGFAVAMLLGLTPDAVVGDLDSLTPEQIDRLERSRIPVRRLPVTKDASDLELAMQLAHSWGARDVIVLGALGGRTDHLLFNLVAGLCYCREVGMRTVLANHDQEAFLVEPDHRILERQGWIASLLCLSATCTGVALKGFEFPLEGESLRRASSRTLSNRILAEEASISLEEGLLLALLVMPGPG